MQSDVSAPASQATKWAGRHGNSGVSSTLQLQLLGAWCGPIFVLLVFISLLISDFLPPPSPALSAEAIKAHFVENLTGIRLGMILYATGFTLMAVWGVVVAVQTAQKEEGPPYLSWIQLCAVAGGTAAGVLEAIVWAVAAFRPDEVPAETTRMMNDVGWFIFLFYWQPFSLWAAAIGLSILRDRSQQPIFPKWLAYMSFWAAIIFIPAGLIVFFKRGPFAYDGALALYMPAGVFFLWCLVVSVELIKGLHRKMGMAAN